MDGYTDIKIKDRKRYLDVALFVDQPDFIIDLLALRKEWKIDKPFPRLKNQSWNELSPFKEIVPKNKDILKRVGEAEYALQFMKDMFMLKDKPDDDLKHKEQILRRFRKSQSWKRFPGLYFQYEVMKLRKKYQKPPNFDQIIISAAIYATVLTDDYKTCHCRLNYAGESLWQPFHEPEPAIVFYPLVRPEEILELFKKEGKNVLKRYEQEHLKGVVFDHDTVSNVARDRKWYWWKRQGLSYGQILTKALDEGERLTRDAVIKAIRRYIKLLTVDI